MAMTSRFGAARASRCSNRRTIDCCSTPRNSCATSTATAALAAITPATMTATARLRLLPEARIVLALGPRKIALAGPYHDGAVAPQIAHGHAPALDASESAVAAILEVPDGAAHRGDAVASTGAEVAVGDPAPERAARSAFSRGRRRGAPVAAVGTPSTQHELGHATRGLRLAHLEQTPVEGAGLGAAARQGAAQRHAASARVHERADRDRGELRHWHEAVVAGNLDRDGSLAHREVHPFAVHRRRRDEHR